MTENNTAERGLKGSFSVVKNPKNIVPESGVGNLWECFFAKNEPLCLAKSCIFCIVHQAKCLVKPVSRGKLLSAADGELDIRDYVDILLDDQASLPSYFEEQAEGPFVPCTPGDDYDPDLCEAAVASQ